MTTLEPSDDDEVPAFWRALGLLGLVDAHMPYPYAEQLAGLARLDLGDDWLRAVCHDNGARLFGLGR